MKNAREEMLRLLQGNKIKCAEIIYGGQWDEEDKFKTIVLKVGHNEEDYAKFLNDLDFEYYSGYGGQELFGIVWLEDGTWCTRGEYDGSEWWEVHSLPDIPKKLLP